MTMFHTIRSKVRAFVDSLTGVAALTRANEDLVSAIGEMQSQLVALTSDMDDKAEEDDVVSMIESAIEENESADHREIERMISDAIESHEGETGESIEVLEDLRSRFDDLETKVEELGDRQSTAELLQTLAAGLKSLAEQVEASC